MLNNSGFKEIIKKQLQTYLENNDDGQVNPGTLWDAAKAVLRGKIILTTAFIKKVKALLLIDLQNKLLELEQLHSRLKIPLLLQQMKPIKQELEKKLRFMRQKYYETGSKATKLLAWRLTNNKLKINKRP